MLVLALGFAVYDDVGVGVGAGVFWWFCVDLMWFSKDTYMLAFS